MLSLSTVTYLTLTITLIPHWLTLLIDLKTIRCLNNLNFWSLIREKVHEIFRAKNSWNFATLTPAIVAIWQWYRGMGRTKSAARRSAVQRAVHHCRCRVQPDAADGSGSTDENVDFAADSGSFDWPNTASFAPTNDMPPGRQKRQRGHFVLQLSMYWSDSFKLQFFNSVFGYVCSIV